MSLFAGTADHYERFRSGVPRSVAELLDRAAPARSPRRLLDLGTGTGFVVAALLEHFDDIIAVDPDADLLSVAERTLRPAAPDGTRLAFAHAAAEAYEPPTGWRADLVTICRAFHWLDQPAVLARLDTRVAPDGAVAVFADSSVWTSPAPWKTTVRETVQEFLGPARRAGSGVFTHHDRPFADVLAESAFSQVTETVIPVRRTRTADSVVGYLHSTSFAAPHLFGDRLAEFDRTVRERLRRHSDDDTYTDDNAFRVLIARRPGHAPAP